MASAASEMAPVCSRQGGNMDEKKALLLSPLAIFPVSFIFIVGKALLGGDLREAFAAPFSALFITVTGYPISIIVWSIVWRGLKRMARVDKASVLAASLIAAEAVFWGVISPLWERDFSDAFCAALMAACGLACGAVFSRLAPQNP
jgi:hypothetical protein